MIPPINIDTILSDPLLLVGASCVVLGPLLFLIALLQWIRMGRKKPNNFVIPHESESPIVPPERPPHPSVRVARASAPPIITPIPETSAMAESADKTVVMGPGVSDMQAQLEIALSEIRMLNKKIMTLESQMDSVAPMNAGEFMQKFLKLAEHVIVLEKDMARLKSGEGGEVAQQPLPPQPVAPPPPPPAPPAPPATHRPPIMPL